MILLECPVLSEVIHLAAFSICQTKLIIKYEPDQYAVSNPFLCTQTEGSLN